MDTLRETRIIATLFGILIGITVTFSIMQIVELIKPDEPSFALYYYDSKEGNWDRLRLDHLRSLDIGRILAPVEILCDASITQCTKLKTGSVTAEP